ncbi:hypothetical protein CAOG_02474 [Capsaspora owczarzaki ATCC 30864]|uniref:Uncharacterized protein n=1 Tax=Capsaspora owczarzaki (strain ATCC 30864) TaxID=595528 RepID=A0A0D2VMD9_CAPO3|nr:hypothetical protein CAOG_02474 [Capsaspora owczarzaki ATCC 30864]KJE91322.1 hypothetical protein CAOG_002474 [Capsaspora owczarzaki ATCC 30864]|eukprot:XP_004349224.1 hypothetical protein CAOG_02474 [Capsaspora owczarzaki ATCC 30864]
MQPYLDEFADASLSATALPNATRWLQSFSTQHAGSFSFGPLGSPSVKQSFVAALLAQVAAAVATVRARVGEPTSDLAAGSLLVVLQHARLALDVLRLVSRERVAVEALQSQQGLQLCVDVVEFATVAGKSASGAVASVVEAAGSSPRHFYHWVCQPTSSSSSSPALDAQTRAALLAAMDACAEDAVKCCVNAIFNNAPMQAAFVAVNGLAVVMNVLARVAASAATLTSGDTPDADADWPVPSTLGFYVCRIVFMMTAMDRTQYLPMVRDTYHGLDVLVQFTRSHVSTQAPSVANPPLAATETEAMTTFDAISHEQLVALSAPAINTLSEVFKLLYNLTLHWESAEDVHTRSDGHRRAERAQFAALVSIVRPVLHITTIPTGRLDSTEDALFTLRTHAVNILTNTPLGCTDTMVLRSPQDPALPQLNRLAQERSLPALSSTGGAISAASSSSSSASTSSSSSSGSSSGAPLFDVLVGDGVLRFLAYQLCQMGSSPRLGAPPQSNSPRELLTPVLMALRIYTRGSRLVRRYTKAALATDLSTVLPAELVAALPAALSSAGAAPSGGSSGLSPADASSSASSTLAPEEGTSLRAALIRLLTSHVSQVNALAGDVLLILCKGNLAKLVRMTGYGNAAGLLANRGLFGQPLDDRSADPYSSESDQEGEGDDVEDEEAGRLRDDRARNINPITGKPFDDQAHDKMQKQLSEMTEEELEAEAAQLGLLFERLNRTGVIRVMGVNENNEQTPLNFPPEEDRQDGPSGP